LIAIALLSWTIAGSASANEVPDWVRNRPQMETDYGGLGRVEFVGEIPTPKERQTAYQYALSELSRMIGQKIVASIESRTREEIGDAERSYAEETVATIQSLSQQRLSGVRINAEWTDDLHKTYHVWLVIGMKDANAQAKAWAMKEEAALRRVIEEGVTGVERELRLLQDKMEHLDDDLAQVQQSLSQLFQEVDRNTEQIEVMSKGELNWSRRLIRAVGFGVAGDKIPPPARKLGAQEAARIDAQKRLIATVEGLSVESEVFIRDHVLESEVIIEQMKGRIRGARQVGETKYHNDGSAEVVLEVDVRDVFAR